MITIKGIIKNVYAKEAFVNKQTGETTPPKFYAQFESRDPSSGKIELLDVRVHEFEEAKAALDKTVAVAIGCYPWINEQTKQASVSYSQIKGTAIRVATSK